MVNSTGEQFRGNLNLIAKMIDLSNKKTTFLRRASGVPQHPQRWFQLLVGLAETVPVHRTTPQLPLTAEI